MYVKIEDVKRIVPGAKTMEEFADSLKQDEPTIVFRLIVVRVTVCRQGNPTELAYSDSVGL
jgi:hypothetical protein